MLAGARRGTILIVPILLLLAGVVILVGVVSVAMGHGGEMAEFATDYLPPDVVTAADVAMLRPPSALWGYNAQVTDEALSRIAQVITERDVEIAVLRQQLAELRAATGSHPAITATLLARSKAASARAARAREAGHGEGRQPGGSHRGGSHLGGPILGGSHLGGPYPGGSHPGGPYPEQAPPGRPLPRGGAPHQEALTQRAQHPGMSAGQTRIAGRGSGLGGRLPDSPSPEPQTPAWAPRTVPRTPSPRSFLHPDFPGTPSSGKRPPAATTHPGRLLEPGPTGRPRCPWRCCWKNSPITTRSWGRPVRDDRGIFERLCLEAFQSGLPPY